MRKYLEGELIWKEGATSVADLIPTLARELATSNWAEVPQQGTTTPWAFDANREIILPSPYVKSDLKLFKTITTTEVLPLEKPTGLITVLGAPTGDDTITVTINTDKVFAIPAASTDTPLEIATKIQQMVGGDYSFLDTYIDSSGDDPVVVVSGADAVVSLTDTSGESITSSEINTPTKTKGRITVNRGIYKSAENIVIIINDAARLTVPVTNSGIDSDGTDLAGQLETGLLAYTSYFEDVDLVDNVLTLTPLTESIISLEVLPVEIAEESYDLEGFVLKGIPAGEGEDINNGTRIGDNVIIKSNKSNTVFDYIEISERTNARGDLVSDGTMKSRPSGRIQLFEAILLDYNAQVATPSDRQTFSLSPSLLVDIDDPLQSGENLMTVNLLEDGVETPANKADYIVDKFNGLIYFKSPVASTVDAIVVSGKYIDPINVGAVIDSSKYEISENKIMDITENHELAGKAVVAVVNYGWSLAYPSSVSAISKTEPRCVLKTSVDTSANLGWGSTKDFFVEFKVDLAASEEEQESGILVRYGDKVDVVTGGTIDDNFASPWVRLAWYKSGAIASGDVTLFPETPILYDMNFTSEYINIVLQGDPSLDPSYSNYLIAPLHIGMLEDYEGARNLNRERKFILAAGSDLTPTYDTTWGDRSANGTTDVIVYKTAVGLPYQSHDVAFYTGSEFADKHFIGASAATNKYHFSELSVVHSVEREVGKIPGVIIGDRSAIFHRDLLTSNKDQFNEYGALLNEYNEFIDQQGNSLMISKEKQWKMFNINTPFWYGAKSPNVFYGIALRVR